ncbi:[protein release factor]-glutamine N5-methyltransferase [Yoonia maricola]|uniref:Release factor glutamine methyltransferase n=1 Tax=Yoonia maricola TaxID=420999 RepID=A0A2M8WMD9_9RHOB|nr:peptide chain release factor N(5)-glutamine methyltransferase [Yoonia maricola]PJI92036.1 [protein release factor]-glutamine N5-methyltransferase [Yoonia maricola]
MLAMAVKQLAAAGVSDSARDARKLFAYASGVDASRVTLILSEDVTEEVATRFDALIARRAQFEPVSHLIGTRDFYGRSFQVTKDVLDPRPETETLIEVALRDPFERVLDLGTGSGCILVTLLAENPKATGIGGDASSAALTIASCNAQRHGVQARVRFVQSDWMAAIRDPFDLIVANPPYIAADEMDDLQPEVCLHEPRIALTDEADGLTAYNKIIAGAPDYLTPGGRLIVEIGATQAEAVSEMMRDAELQQIRVIPDLDHRDRVVEARKP